jgi:hypothetical protein
MTQKMEQGAGVGLRRFAAVEGDLIVNRPPRRVVTGIEFHTQECRLVLDAPDAAGAEAYPCRISDVSDEGFGVLCRAVQKLSHPLRPGAQSTLQNADGERVRVEIRWIKNGRLGLRRMTAKA